MAITGTWNRSDLTHPATLTASNGQPITLQPGTTWEELVPDAIPVTTMAAPPPAPAGSASGSGTAGGHSTTTRPEPSCNGPGRLDGSCDDAQVSGGVPDTHRRRRSSAAMVA